MVDLEKWLDENGLSQLFQPLHEHEIDFELLLDLAESDLKELGLTLGARKRLLKAVDNFKARSDPGHRAAGRHEALRSSRIAPAAEGDRSERRHLTVVFVDLVGSTALSARLDPEDLQPLVATYHETAGRVIAHHGGHVARIFGDGILCFFGWPQAQEDDAERAVRAGLEVAEAIRTIKLATGEPLQVRVGISSGLVVISDLLGEEATEGVFGETPNLAARLQELAEPGQVVISEATRRLVGRIFGVEELGTFALKGIEGKTRTFLATCVRELESRFEAKLSWALPEMVGRDAELTILTERWRRAKTGEGQCIVISGEAGIGKSRLVEALIRHIEDDEPIKVRYQCSPHHSTSPLYPAIRQLFRASGIAHDDTAQRKFAKLAEILRCGELDLFAELLGLAAAERKGTASRDARQLRLRTLKAFADEMVALSRTRPLLFIVDDIHWIDATTLELVNIALSRISQERVLVVITARPQFELDFSGNPVVGWFSLGRLSSRDVQAIVNQRIGGKPISAAMLKAIETRSDGIPLFVEEITNALIQSGEISDSLQKPFDVSRIPDTLQESLMARVDRLNVAKEIAQTAACIGREFSGELLRKLIDVDEEGFAWAIDQLIGAQIVFRHLRTEGETYVFKHALVRDAAYSSLLRKHRRKIHAQIFAVLEEDGETEHEILAKHAAEAGDLEKSIELWRSAAQTATGRCAYHEAADHLEAAIALAAELPRNAELQEQALQMLGWLAFTWVAAEGYMSDRARDAAQRGVALAGRLTESRHRFVPRYAEWALSLATGPHNEALARIEAIVSETDSLGSSPHCFYANAFAAYSYLAVGRLADADAKLAIARKAYEPERHNRQSDRFGHIPGPDMFYRLALLRLLQGRLDEVTQHLDQAHGSCPLGIDIHAEAQLLMKTALVAMIMKDFARLETYTRRLRAIAEDYGLKLASICTDLYRAPLIVARGEVAGAQLFALTSARYEAEIMTYLSAARWVAQADVLLRADFPEEAAHACNHAAELIRKTGETMSEPELCRLRAKLALADDNEDEAFALIGKAIELARRQGAGLWELRASVDLAEMTAGRGERQNAAQLLRPVYERFASGGDRPDLQEAGALLASL